MLKKVALSGVLLSSLVSFASADSQTDGFGVEVGSKVVSSSEKKFLGIQKLSEVVGENGTENYIEGFYRVDNYRVGMRYTNIAEFDENKLELTANVLIPSSSINGLTYSLGIGAGYGEQARKRATLSTDMTAATYITSGADMSSHYVSTEVDVKRANYLNFTVQASIKYALTDSLNLNAGIESEQKYWEINYKLTDRADNVYLSGLSQRAMKGFVSIEYKF